MNIIKRKPLIIMSIMIIVLIFGVVWYNSPHKLLKLNADDVLEISILDGNTGTSLHVTEREHLAYIIENLNTIKLKKGKVSIGYSGASFRMTIQLMNGKEADGWNRFIINSKDTIRKDPFFYNVVEGTIDYYYIEKLIQESNNE